MPSANANNVHLIPTVMLMHFSIMMYLDFKLKIQINNKLYQNDPNSVWMLNLTKFKFENCEMDCI